MDKWMRQIDAAFVDRSNADEAYRFTYQNRSGERIDYYRDHVRITSKTYSGVIPWQKVKAIGLNRRFKLEESSRIMSFETGDETIGFMVDTETNGNIDFSTVFNQTRRLAVANRNEPYNE